MRSRVYVITDDNIGWVLDGVSVDVEPWNCILNCAKGHHRISIDHELLGPTCGLLPVGIDSTVLSTSGLRWNLGKSKLSTLHTLLITCRWDRILI